MGAGWIRRLGSNGARNAGYGPAWSQRALAKGVCEAAGLCVYFRLERVSAHPDHMYRHPISFLLTPLQGRAYEPQRMLVITLY